MRHAPQWRRLPHAYNGLSGLIRKRRHPVRHIGSRLRGGRSGIDTLATVACAGLLVVVAAVLGQTRPSGGPPAEAHPLSVKDASQLAEIHQAMVIFANEWGGLLPRPGLINRLPVELDGQLRQIPGRGEEDISLNTTANLYSSLIAQNYFAPTLVISPVERSPSTNLACHRSSWRTWLTTVRLRSNRLSWKRRWVGCAGDKSWATSPCPRGLEKPRASFGRKRPRSRSASIRPERPRPRCCKVW